MVCPLDIHIGYTQIFYFRLRRTDFVAEEFGWLDLDEDFTFADFDFFEVEVLFLVRALDFFTDLLASTIVLPGIVSPAAIALATSSSLSF